MKKIFLGFALATVGIAATSAIAVATTTSCSSTPKNDDDKTQSADLVPNKNVSLLDLKQTLYVGAMGMQDSEINAENINNNPNYKFEIANSNNNSININISIPSIYTSMYVALSNLTPSVLFQNANDNDYTCEWKISNANGSPTNEVRVNDQKYYLIVVEPDKNPQVTRDLNNLIVPLELTVKNVTNNSVYSYEVSVNISTFKDVSKIASDFACYQQMPVLDQTSGEALYNSCFKPYIYTKDDPNYGPVADPSQANKQIINYLASYNTIMQKMSTFKTPSFNNWNDFVAILSGNDQNKINVVLTEPNLPSLLNDLSAAISDLANQINTLGTSSYLNEEAIFKALIKQNSAWNTYTDPAACERFSDVVTSLLNSLN